MEPDNSCRYLKTPLKTQEVPTERPYLGIVFEPHHSKADMFNGCSSFIKVYDIRDGSPAQMAGLMKGDLIISVGNKKVCGKNGDITERFRDVVQGLSPGSATEMVILRKGITISKSLTPSRWPLMARIKDLKENTPLCKTVKPSLLMKKLSGDALLERYRQVREDLLWAGISHYDPAVNSNAPSPTPPLPLMKIFYSPESSLLIGKEILGNLSRSATREDWDIKNLLTIGGYPTLIDDCPDLTFDKLLEAALTVSASLRDIRNKLGTNTTSLLSNNALFPWEKDSWNLFVEAGASFPLEDIIRASSPVLACLNKKSVQALKDSLATSGRAAYKTDTPFGRVILGSPGDDTYTDDAFIIVDPGGNDTYLNNAGGTRDGMPLSIVIDLSGDDIYLGRGDFSEGAGLLGTGVLIDLGGKDRFFSGMGGLGSGIFGLGILINEGEGTEFHGREFSLGTGFFGMGILLNMDGQTLYTAPADAEGLGLPGGTGILLDTGGDDTYTLGGRYPDFRDPDNATVSMGLGFGKGIRPEGERRGLPGGLGILVDTEGDDSYSGDYFSEGGGYFLGLGILGDMEGNDRYTAGRYSQGAGIHRAGGLLIDLAGDDTYTSTYGVSEGLGHDYGFGILADLDGDDSYFGGTLSLGAATNSSMGILLDPGGNDSFRFLNKSLGYGYTDTSIGVFLKE